MNRDADVYKQALRDLLPLATAACGRLAAVLGACGCQVGRPCDKCRKLRARLEAGENAITVARLLVTE